MEWTVFSVVAMAGSALSSMIALGAVFITTPLFDLIGHDKISFYEITVLNLFIVLTSALVSGLVHHRAGNVDQSFLKRFVPVTVIGAFAGGKMAQYVPEWGLRVLFAAVAVMALVLALMPAQSRLAAMLRTMMGLPRDGRGFDGGSAVSPVMAFILIAFTSGLVGVGGGLLLIPLLVKVVRFHALRAVGSMMFIGLSSTTGALVGRIGTPLPPWQAIVAVVIGAGVGAFAGASATTRLPPRVVPVMITTVIVLSAGQTLLGQFTG